MKKIAIIGGGIAGLSAGIYAQLNGFDSVILEKNADVGGECISWQREGCTIDGCIHWLTGSNSGDLNDIWKRVGALENVKIIEPQYLYEYQKGDKKICIHKDIEKLKGELLAISPQDGEVIEEFIGYVKAMQSMSMPLEPMDQMSLAELLRLGKSMSKVSKIVKMTSQISIGEYAERFKSEFLKSFILSYMPKEYQLMSFVVTLATFTSGNGNIPEGSSMQFCERMKDKYLSLGGEIELNFEVADVLVENKIAKKIIATSGREINCDYVIPACDVDVTYHKILKGKYNDERFEKRYNEEKNNPIIANCYFSYAVENEVASSLPHMSLLECDGIKVAEKKRTVLGLKVYDYIDNKNGLTTVISPLLQDGEDFEYWDNLYKRDRAKYKVEKKRVGEEIMAEFIAINPSLQGKMKLIDSATPVTYARYLGAHKGAYMAFMLTKKSKQMMHSGKIKGIKNLFMAGQWLITPGGLPTAVVTGKLAIQRICKSEKKAFVR